MIKAARLTTQNEVVGPIHGIESVFSLHNDMTGQERVLHWPQIPARQSYGMSTPSSSETSRTVCPPRRSLICPAREKVTASVPTAPFSDSTLPGMSRAAGTVSIVSVEDPGSLE